MKKLIQRLVALFKVIGIWGIIIIILFIALLCVFYSPVSTEWIVNPFNTTLSPWITIGTFCLTIIIGIQNLINNLDNRLTVHFKITDKKEDDNYNMYLATCEKASLASKSDIRAFAQQIGRQMTNTTQLKFDLNYTKKKPKIIWEDKQWVKHYEATYYLEEFPSGYKEHPKHKKKYYKVWWWLQAENGEKEKLEKRIINGLRPDVLPDTIQHVKDNGEDEHDDSKEIPKTINQVLLNFSNHHFTEEQKKEATSYLKILTENIRKNQRAKISINEINEDQQLHYLKFPDINPEYSNSLIKCMASEYLQKIKDLKPLAVHISGEFTFTHQVVLQLQKEGIECIASTTERIVEMEGDTKKSNFNFVQFRKY